MKRILAITLLFLSFASAAFADGPGQIPPAAKSSTQPQRAVVLLADGPGQIPPSSNLSA
ncbi:MAG: hypothetical protein WBC78_03605 [Candidatus Sulfotelmatobacter sp.]